MSQPSPTTLPQRAGWRCVRALMPGFFIANLEGSVVNVALPDIQRDLEVGLSVIGWVPMACLVPTAALCPLMGAIADRAGRRRIYMLGLLLIALGSIVAALAPGWGLLLVGRALQGIGSGALIANGLAIVAEQFEAHERGRALGLMTAMVGLGAILAPPLGGALSEYIGWRGVFMLSVVGSALGLWWVNDRIPADPTPEPGWWRRVPWRTALWLVATVSLGISGIWSGGRWGWQTWGTLLPLLGAGVFGGVTWLESRRGDAPLIDTRRLGKRTLWSLGALALGSIVLSALGFALPLYLNARYGLQGLRLGLQVIPFPVGLVIGAVMGGQLGDRRGTGLPVIAGLGLFVAGIFGYSSFQLAALAVAGLGLGAFSVGNNAEIVHGRDEGVGSLTGLVGLLRLSGQVLGVAVAGAVIEQIGSGSGVTWIAWSALPAILVAGMAYRYPGAERH